MNDFLFLPMEPASRATSRANHRPAQCSRVEQPGREEPFSESLEKARKRQVDEPAESLQVPGLQAPGQPAGTQPAAGPTTSGDQAGAGAPQSASGSQPVAIEAPQAAGGQAFPVSVGAGPETGAAAAGNTAVAENTALAGPSGQAGQRPAGSLPGEAADTTPPAATAQPAPGGSGQDPEPAVRSTLDTPAAFEAVITGAGRKAAGPEGAPGQAAGASSSQPAGSGPLQGGQPVRLNSEPPETVGLELRPAAAHPEATLEDSGTGRGQSGAGSSPGEAQAAFTAYDGASPVQGAKSNFVEPARLAEARQARFVDQLASGIRTLERSGETALRLQLHPQNLGKIDLRVTSGAEGLRVTLTALQADTRQLLNSHLPDLRQALEQAGVNLAGLSIGYNSPQGGAAQPERWTGKPGQGAGKVRTAEASGESLVEGPRPRSLVPAGEVDYRV